MLAWYLPYYNAHANDTTAPYPGITQLLAALKAANCPLAVVSNKPDRTVKELAAIHFPGLLEIAVGESARVRRKPNPDAVLEALRHMGVSPEDAIYVGDTEVDVQTAENAGLACAVVGWGFRTEEELREVWTGRIFQSAGELCAWLLEDRDGSERGETNGQRF